MFHGKESELEICKAELAKIAQAIALERLTINCGREFTEAADLNLGTALFLGSSIALSLYLNLQKERSLQPICRFTASIPHYILAPLPLHEAREAQYLVARMLMEWSSPQSIKVTTDRSDFCKITIETDDPKCINAIERIMKHRENIPPASPNLRR